MGKEESQQITRRTTRASASVSVASNAVEATKKRSFPPLTLSDLVFGDEPFSFNDLVSSFPSRRTQILEFMDYLGPLNSPMLPTLIYGGPSTGKTSITLQIFRHLKRPFVYSSCMTCYNPRILFESILNQLMLHRKTASNEYSSAKRCDKPSDFVNFARDALVNVIGNLKEQPEKAISKNPSGQCKGHMIYLIFDNLELVQDWDKSCNILAFLFNLYDILKMPEVGFIFITNATPDAYYLNMGCEEPVPINFPDYTEDDLRQIFMMNHTNKKLYSSFLE